MKKSSKFSRLGNLKSGRFHTGKCIRQNSLQCRGIEGIRLIAVDVQNAQQRALRGADRHDDLRSGGGGARNMAGEGFDIGHNLRFIQTCGSPADPFAERDNKAPVPPPDTARS